MRISDWSSDVCSSDLPSGDVMSTQEGFGKILNEIARDKSPLAERIVTTSPDVTVSTNLGPWVNRRGIFARKPLADTFRDQQVPSAQKDRKSTRLNPSH